MPSSPEPADIAMEGDSGPVQRAGRREWIGLAVIALPCLLYSMDLTVLHLAVPQLTRELAPTSAELLWIIDIYGFLVAGSLITMGTLGDRIGRRRLLLIGAAAFGAASVLAAFSNSAAMLIASRAILGVAGATVAPSTLSLIRNMFHDPAQRTVAISVWVMSFSIGGAIGPLVGGVMLEAFWWGSVFLLAVPVMVLLLAVGPFLLPEYRDESAGRLDLTSAAMSLGAVLAVIYGLKQVAQSGVSATALALKKFPTVNAVYSDKGIVLRGHVNVGVAVATEDGLLVPAVKNADQKNLKQLAAEIKDLADRARTNKLKPDEVRGGTFTITNPGVFGSVISAPVIPVGQSGILGVGMMVERPVARGGKVEVRPISILSLSFDHRTFDGSTADQFLEEIRKNLEEGKWNE